MPRSAGGSTRLLENLRTLWRVLEDKAARKWRRSLPFGDHMVDRFERAERLGFGAGASVYDSALVIGDVRVGERTWIGPSTVLDGSGGLEIGSYCSISAGVQIYTHDTVAWALSGGEERPERAPVRIGSRCYIGPNTVVAKGVTIGEGTVVGAMSLVLRDLPAGCKAYGIPCRVAGDAPGRERA
jgi:acetyltransferase-like isoleucine patch superfamily enzyme